jgi:hypothetical protein
MQDETRPTREELLEENRQLRMLSADQSRRLSEYIESSDALHEDIYARHEASDKKLRAERSDLHSRVLRAWRLSRMLRIYATGLTGPALDALRELCTVTALPGMKEPTLCPEHDALARGAAASAATAEASG